MSIREQLMDMIGQVATMDLGKVTNYRFRVDLARDMMAKQAKRGVVLSDTTILTIAGSMKVNLTNGLHHNDAELYDFLVESYADIILNMAYAADHDFGDQAETYILAMASGRDSFEVEYTG